MYTHFTNSALKEEIDRILVEDRIFFYYVLFTEQIHRSCLN